MLQSTLLCQMTKLKQHIRIKMDREEVEEELGFYLLDNKVMQLFGK